MGDASQAVQLPMLEHDISQRGHRCCQYAGRCATAMAAHPTHTALLEEVEEEGARMVEGQSLETQVDDHFEMAFQEERSSHD